MTAPKPGARRGRPALSPAGSVQLTIKLAPEDVVALDAEVARRVGVGERASRGVVLRELVRTHLPAGTSGEETTGTS